MKREFKTVEDYMKAFGKDEYSTRVYVDEIDDEVYGGSVLRYWDAEVVNVYDHNGDMVCEVREVR